MKTRWREYIQTTHAGFSEHIRISCIIALFLFLSRQGLAENRVMLVGVDGATWTVIGRLIEKGELPAFKRLTDEGSYMPRFNTMGSTVSPVVWTSVATGRLPKDHGILGFTERLPSGKVIPISGKFPFTAKGWRKIVSCWLALTVREMGSTSFWEGHPDIG